MKRHDGWPKNFTYLNGKLLTVASFQNITDFFVFISNTFFTVLVCLCRFMPGVLTPIFTRREGRGLLATDIITFS